MPDFDYERLAEFDFVRATEAAALNTLPWLGKGQKELADEAACDAIRGMFDLMPICGDVVIGEGIKDESAGIFKGEKLGAWPESATRFAIALDPVDGTTNVAGGMANSISCIAAGMHAPDQPSPLLDIPAFYMSKLSYGKAIRAEFNSDPHLPLTLDAPIAEVIKMAAKILQKSTRDITIIVLNRERNMALVEQIRSVGANLRMIQDGDIAAALAPAMFDSEIDLYAGIGGAPEAVLAAVGLRCLGGGMKAKIWCKDELETQRLNQIGWGDKLDHTFLSADMASGENLIFCATGITDSPLLRGVIVKKNIATTRSVLMRQRNQTIRYIRAHHDTASKTIRLRSTHGENKLI